MRRASDGQVYYLQPRLGYTPVEQGGGPNMSANKVRLGYNGAGSLRLQVDSSDFGDLTNDQNLPAKLAGLGLSAIGSYAFARVITSQGQVNQGGLIAGSNLIYSSTNSGDGAGNNSGLIGGGTWRAHGAFSSGERTLFQRVS
ncbi:tail fiber protein H [Pseudomonas syringae pv. actinidiae]|nr:tail fiber protein H [Pseudomonas syringae pv. actinidiae]